MTDANEQIKPINPVPQNAQNLLSQRHFGNNTENSEGYVSSGSMGRALSAAEDAIATTFARLIIANGLILGSKCCNELDTENIIDALRPLFEHVADPVCDHAHLRQIFQTDVKANLDFGHLDAAFAEWFGQ